jgi:hypothetical protein
MKSSMRLPEDIEKINKFTSYQLPNKFKIVGLVIFVVSILLIVTSFKNYCIDDKYHNLFERIVLSSMVMGTLIISISREKLEDELIAKIRMQSYHYAVLGTVLFYLIIPFVHFIYELLFYKMPVIGIHPSNYILFNTMRLFIGA